MRGYFFTDSMKKIMIFGLLILANYSYVNASVMWQKFNDHITTIQASTDCPAWCKTGGKLGNGEQSEASINELGKLWETIYVNKGDISKIKASWDTTKLTPANQNYILAAEALSLLIKKDFQTSQIDIKAILGQAQKSTKINQAALKDVAIYFRDLKIAELYSHIAKDKQEQDKQLAMQLQNQLQNQQQNDEHPIIPQILSIQPEQLDSLEFTDKRILDAVLYTNNWDFSQIDLDSNKLQQSFINKVEKKINQGTKPLRIVIGPQFDQDLLAQLANLKVVNQNTELEFIWCNFNSINPILTEQTQKISYVNCTFPKDENADFDQFFNINRKGSTLKQLKIVNANQNPNLCKTLKEYFTSGTFVNLEQLELTGIDSNNPIFFDRYTEFNDKPYQLNNLQKLIINLKSETCAIIKKYDKLKESFTKKTIPQNVQIEVCSAGRMNTGDEIFDIALAGGANFIKYNPITNEDYEIEDLTFKQIAQSNKQLEYTFGEEIPVRNQKILEAIWKDKFPQTEKLKIIYGQNSFNSSLTVEFANTKERYDFLYGTVFNLPIPPSSDRKLPHNDKDKSNQYWDLTKPTHNKRQPENLDTSAPGTFIKLKELEIIAEGNSVEMLEENHSPIYLAEYLKSGQTNLQKIRMLTKYVTEQGTDFNPVFEALAANNTKPRPEIKEFSIMSIFDTPQPQMANLLEQGVFPNLEILEVNQMALGRPNINEITRVLRTGALPKLRHIRLQSVNIDHQDLTNIIEAAKAGYLYDLEGIYIQDANYPEEIYEMFYDIDLEYLPRCKGIILGNELITPPWIYHPNFQ